MTLPLAVFEKLPKTDLHVHLDGSLRLEVSWGEGGPRERLRLDTLRLVQPDPSGLSG